MTSTKSYSVRWTIFAISLCALPLIIFLCTAGNKSGEEFSPDDFSSRRFTYNKMPWFGIVIQGVEYEDTTSVLANDLVANGFVTVTSGGTKTWHLITDNVSDQNSPDFDAKFLVRYLDMVNENNLSIWFDFNDKFPTLARQFWPIIANLSREKLYLDVADLMFRAKSLEPTGKIRFRNFMKKHALQALEKKAKTASENNDYLALSRILTRAIDIEPTKKRYISRAEAYQKLGEVKKYQLDLKAAEE